MDKYHNKELKSSNIKKSLYEKPQIGFFSKTVDSSLIEAAGYGGMDFVILDMEHGPSTLSILQNHIRAADLSGLMPIVRVKKLDSNAIGSVLDIGAKGVQIPNIKTAEEAAQAVAAARFHPNGNRGVCRFVRAAEYGKMSKDKYFRFSYNIIVIVQVEGLDGLHNIDSILEVEGIDVIFIGPYDLSQALGAPGITNSPQIKKIIDDIRYKSKLAGINLGIFVENIEELTYYLKQGFNYLSYSVDISIFREACQSFIYNVEVHDKEE